MLKTLLLPSTLLASLLFGAPMATVMASPLQSKAPKDHYLPVFVHVDDHGTITQVLPADKLSPNIDHLVRTTLDQMISKPAHDKHGKPIPSQFIITLSMHSTAQAQGAFRASLAYVSIKSVPPGHWHWYRDNFTGKLRLIPTGTGINLTGPSLGQRSAAAQAQRLQGRWVQHQRQEAAQKTTGHFGH